MEYRFLGNSGLKISALSLGSWVTEKLSSGVMAKIEKILANKPQLEPDFGSW